MQHKHLRFGAGFRVVLGDDRSQAAQMTLEPQAPKVAPIIGTAELDQWLFVVEGEGTAIVEGERVELRQGSLLFVERGESHEIRNTGGEPLRTLNFYVPPAYKKQGESLPAGKPIR